MITKEWWNVNCACALGTSQALSPSARILSLKLSFLAHLLDTTYTSLSREVFRSSLNSECEEISLIQQCRLLEEPYGTNFTGAVLQGDSSLSSVKNDGQWQDSLISQHDSLKHLESLKDVPWCKVWDAVLDSCPNAAKYASSVFNILSWALFGDHQCRYCSQPIPTDQSLFEHISQVKPSSIINSLKDLSDQENFATAIEFLFDVGHKFCLLHVPSYT